MYPFSFQKGNKAAGCEDAPPVAETGYSIVCDGLGGAGLTKYSILDDETQQTVVRTSGYLGSRIVCDCVNAFYESNCAELERSVVENGGRNVLIPKFLCGLKAQLTQTLDEHMKKWDIKPSVGKVLKDFPTTLASAMYFRRPEGITVLSVWAGDSRVYLLTPSKGLQLLSLDDAKDAEDEMNSTSEMTNCISAGNVFHLNYALYDLNEPGLVFCCSDGCFDYLRSPLHFEWLLLYTMLECMPDCDAANIGTVLADSIRDNLYKIIGDDTTMAGLIVGIDSAAQMKRLFQERKDKSDKRAVNMNGYLEQLKMLQAERDSARKKCSLMEERVIPFIQEEVCSALRDGSGSSSLHAKLSSMPCYTEDYAKRLICIREEVEKQYEAELKKAEELSLQERNACRKMLILDYIKFQHDNFRVQNNKSFPDYRRSHGFHPMVRCPISPVQSKIECAKPEDAQQIISVCIAVIRHPFFREVAVPSVPDDECDQYLLDLQVHLEKLHTIMGNRELSFEDMWNQAFFSTERYSAEFQQYSKGDDYLSAVMDSPQAYPFVSALTRRKISEYRDQTNRNNDINKRLSEEQQRRIKNLPEEFWRDHKDEILDMILSETGGGLRRMFSSSGPQLETLHAYADSKQVLENTLSRAKEIQKSIDGIWAQYRQDYQLILQISEKGVC